MILLMTTVICMLQGLHGAAVGIAHLRLYPVKQVVDVLWCRKPCGLLHLDSISPQVLILQKQKDWMYGVSTVFDFINVLQCPRALSLCILSFRGTALAYVVDSYLNIPSTKGSDEQHS